MDEAIEKGQLTVIVGDTAVPAKSLGTEPSGTDSAFLSAVVALR